MRSDAETRESGDAETPAPRARVSESPRPSFHPSKRLGQNFLTDQRIIDRIVEALEPKPDETILEIGPGRGALTSSLVERAGSLVAIEFDRKLIPLLTEKFGAQTNFKLVQSDALVTEVCEVIRPATQARVVANLPYNVATAILQRLIEQRTCVTEMVLMLQKEVVERITAAPGSAERGYLSVFVQAYCETEKLFDVAPGSFRPAPKVWSSVLRLILRPRLAMEVKDEKLLWQIVSAGFAQRRKTILNNLRNAPVPLGEIVKSHGGASIVLCQAEVDLQRRAETLTLTEWSRIARVLE
ncbi:MAG TPA: 16S rRNA (adenine(1518)-N(6)/adenine(1519)-N(6))-dimethyltransferase RsmA [Pyrinomonadaceae bacterium]|jgi:16S rRNA (adenine1518-N6/adenine1519-N6)-dimethyltransferase|nr:16S rRNA (adenine(1518)-N(6)/adenine(1519)-N(6))-dimethyltransferase RsmA [Pyrinomonadaceae bacterium]